MLVSAFSFPQQISAQDDIEDMNLTGWRFGINMGMYLANKNTAQFYSGEPQNENSIQWVLNNYYWYQEILQELNGNEIIKNPGDVPQDWMGEYNQWRQQYNVAQGDTSKWWIYYPEGLKYDAAISPGFYAKYNFNNSTGIFIQSNYVKLKTSGIFQMVIDSVTYTSQPAYRQGYMRGVEERVNIDIGLSKFYTVGKITNLYVETGFHLNSTRVLENRIQIGRKEYSIINLYGNRQYVPNSNMTAYDIYQGGVGFGIFLAGGVKFVFNETVAIDLGTQMYWKKVKLEGYNNFYGDYYFYVRLIFDLFGDSQ
nr:hypothetical protein [Bacteroidota bacterium]